MIKIGDTIRYPVKSELQVMDDAALNQGLRAVIRGEMPSWTIEPHRDVVITSQEMADRANDGEEV